MTIVVAAVGLVAALAWATALRHTEKRAIIVDQLDLTAPNPEFVGQATDTLRRAGYEVDYVAGTDVTVRLFQDLPKRRDDLVLLRVHSARIMADGAKTDDVAVFTGEMIDVSRYRVSGIPSGPSTAVAQALASTSRPSGGPTSDSLSLDEQSRLIPVFYNPSDRELPFFGLRPTFIERDLEGSFKGDSMVVLMGCDGLRSKRLAEAFARKGAGTFVSWDNPVSAPHTDAATQRLLELVVRDGLPVETAVARTMSEMGPDPEYKGNMVVYSRQGS